jgi:Tfp pilus assembly protein PilF
MKRQGSVVRTLVGMCMAVVLTAAPAYAQLGSLQGKVVDEAGQPVPDAEVTLVYTGELNIKHATKTNAQGIWTRAGLLAVGGRWNITATKDGQTGVAPNIEVGIGSANVPDIVIRKGGAGAAMTPAEAAAREKEAAALKALLTEVDTALAANNLELGASKLEEAMPKLPDCDRCHVQLGDIYQRMKQFEKAEAAYKQAISINANSAAAHDGLAAIYNTTNRLDLAAEAAAKAAQLHGASGGGDATSAYNTGAIMMNSGKIAEAKAQFLRAIQLDPKMAEAHFQLGMTYINEGNFGEAVKSLEQYLSLAPAGPNSQMAKDMLPELKKMQQ